MNLFLTPEEIEQMTDFKQSSAQVRALRIMGYSPDVATNGTPKLLRSIVESKQTGKVTPPVIQNQQPNRDALAAMLLLGA